MAFNNYGKPNDSCQKVGDELTYTYLDFNSTISEAQLNSLRNNLMQNIGFLNANKQKIRNSEYTLLINYHQYALNTLDNMVKIKQVELNNPINNGCKTLIYNKKGLLEQLPARRIKEEWEEQFDQNLINPPCYSLPPSNCFRPQGP